MRVRSIKIAWAHLFTLGAGVGPLLGARQPLSNDLEFPMFWAGGLGKLRRAFEGQHLQVWQCQLPVLPGNNRPMMTHANVPQVYHNAKRENLASQSANQAP